MISKLLKATNKWAFDRCLFNWVSSMRQELLVH